MSKGEEKGRNVEIKKEEKRKEKKRKDQRWEVVRSVLEFKVLASCLDSRPT